LNDLTGGGSGSGGGGGLDDAVVGCGDDADAGQAEDEEEDEEEIEDEDAVGNKKGEGDVDDVSAASAKIFAKDSPRKRQRTEALVPAVACAKVPKPQSTLLGKEVMLLFF